MALPSLLFLLGARDVVLGPFFLLLRSPVSSHWEAPSLGPFLHTPARGWGPQASQSSGEGGPMHAPSQAHKLFIKPRADLWGLAHLRGYFRSCGGAPCAPNARGQRSNPFPCSWWANQGVLGLVLLLLAKPSHWEHFP